MSRNLKSLALHTAAALLLSALALASPATAQSGPSFRIKSIAFPGQCLSVKNIPHSDGMGGLTLQKCGTGPEFVFAIGGTMSGISASGMIARRGETSFVCAVASIGEPIVPANVTGPLVVDVLECPRSDDPLWTLTNGFSENGGLIRKLNRFPNPKQAQEDTGLCLQQSKTSTAIVLDSCVSGASTLMWKAEKI
jgi:hypothetical protein